MTSFKPDASPTPHCNRTMSVCVSVRTVTVEVSLLVHSGSGAPNALEQVTTAVLVKVPCFVVRALTEMIFSAPAPLSLLHSCRRVRIERSCARRKPYRDKTLRRDNASENVVL